MPGFEVVGWFGLLAPAGTPAPVVRKLHAEVVRITFDPAAVSFKDLLANDGKRYLLVMMINHPNAILSQAAQDAILQWVYARNPVVSGPPLPTSTAP